MQALQEEDESKDEEKEDEGEGNEDEDEGNEASIGERDKKEKERHGERDPAKLHRVRRYNLGLANICTEKLQNSAFQGTS